MVKVWKVQTCFYIFWEKGVGDAVPDLRKQKGVIIKRKRGQGTVVGGGVWERWIREPLWRYRTDSNVRL